MLNKYNFLVNKFVRKEKTQPEIAGVLISEAGTVATDRYTLLEVSAPEVERSDFPLVPGQEVGEIIKHIMPIDTANLLLTNLKKIKTNLPILENAAAIKVPDPETQAGFVTTDLETAQPVIYRRVDGEFPDYKQIMPSGEPERVFFISPEYLKRVAEVFLATGGASVEVKLYKNDMPITFEGKTPVGQTVKALIMPIKA